jgi:large subunit ribosomal protein L24
MAKPHIKVGQTVHVIAGAHKGASGKVLSINWKKQRAVVENVNMIKKHTRKSQAHPEGAIVEREGTIHVSNLMNEERFTQSKRAAASA